MQVPLRVREQTAGEFVEIDVPAWAWGALVGVILVLLAIDLFRHRHNEEPKPKVVLLETLTWIACGLAFGAFVAAVFGGDAFGEYLSGYLIEKSLSVDNVFVWSMLFTTLAVPLAYQHRVLFWGVMGALVLRAIFIFAGSALIARFWWLLLVFGVFLVFTGLKVIRHRDDEAQESGHRTVGWVRRVIPVTEDYEGQHFLVRRAGKLIATPLLVALIVVEVTDVIFAVDSVPAILAVSHEPYLVFASNAFAILGLRAMYFLLAEAKARFHYLSHALGGILVFVGLKMAVSHWYHLNTWISLGVILAILVAAVVASQIWAERKERELASLSADAEPAAHPTHR